MHHFCAVWSKTETAESQLADRLEQFVLRRLIFEPDEVLLHRLGPHVTVFGASVGQVALAIAAPCHVSDAGACLVGGLPTFERFPELAPSTAMEPARWFDDLLDRHDPQSLYLDVGGDHSVVRARPESVYGHASFSGLESLFWLENDLYAAIGNHPGLVAAMQSGGAYSETNVGALAWIPATTLIVGHGSPWTEVERVPTGHWAEIDRGRVSLRSFATTSSTPPDDVDDKGGVASLYEQAIDRVVARYRWYLATGMRMEAHLTGGKDSRTNLALLTAAGGLERLERIVTLGSPTNGDVIVAGTIAASLGLENHEVRPGPKAAVNEVDWADHRDWFAHSPWRYELYLTPWDGREWASGGLSPVTLTGAGGEAMRGGAAPDRAAEPPPPAERMLRWHERQNSLGVIDDETDAAQRAFLHEEAERLDATGPVNFRQRFYVEHVMGTWGASQRRNAAQPELSGLLDLDLSRLTHLRADMGDELPYEIITRCAPELLDFPFVNDEWEGREAARAQRDGVAHPPVEVPQAADFPWQFALYRDWRDSLVREVLSHVSLWRGAVVPERLEALLETPVEPFRSGDAKSLFGLLAATSHLRGELHTERDAAAAGSPLRATGNGAETARGWFAHRRGRARAVAPLPAGPRAWDVVEPADAEHAHRAAADARAVEATRKRSEQRAGELEHELELAQRTARRLARRLEHREHALADAREALRTGRAEARAIRRSGSWAVVAALSRMAAVLRRDGPRPAQRLERLARLEAPQADETTSTGGAQGEAAAPKGGDRTGRRS